MISQLWSILRRRKRVVVEYYSSYQAALRACPSSYEDDDLVAVIAAKTAAIRDQYRSGARDISLTDAQILYPLSLVGTPARVLDFGGGCGIHRAVAEMVFGDVFDWQVVETPAMAEAGRGIWGDGFFSRIQDTFWLNGDRQIPSIVLAVGSLPYTAAPYAFLWELVGLGAEYLYISRTVMADKAMYGVQRSRLSENGPGPFPTALRMLKDKDVYYPITVLAKDRVEDMLVRHYEILLRLDEGAFDCVRQYGYLARRG